MSVHPQTPQSPSRSSPCTSDPLSSSLSSSMTSIAATLPTPAHSVTGSCIPSEMSQDMAMGEDSPQKRKRPLDDIDGPEQKKAHLEDDGPSMDMLHEDVGEKYLLCRTAHPPSFPRLSEDLFEAYDLTGIAAEVARVLPNGERNAMRKTYKGHIKKMGIAGHFESVRKEQSDNDSLLMMYHHPLEDWINTEVHGKDITSGLADDVLQHLSRATTMAKGPISKDDWDASVLGDLSSDKAAGAGKQASSSARLTAPNTPVHPLGKSKVGQQLAGGEAARPRRAGKKRSYGDSSFEGYGEGFPDDDLGNDVGYSTGDGDDRIAGQKRRKKKAHLLNVSLQNPGAVQSPFPGGPVRQQSYGPGMVGA